VLHLFTPDFAGHINMSTRNILNIVLFFVCVFGASAGAYAQSDCAQTDYDCKISYYRNQISRDARDIESYYSLADAYQGKRDYQSSIEPLDTYIASGNVKQEYLADAYNMRGFARYKTAAYDIAVKDYTRAIDLFPKAHFYYNRGRTYEAQKQYDLSIADQNRAIGLDPKYSSAYFSRGYAYMMQTNYPPAIADFTKVMDLDPKEAEAYYDRGTIYYRQKKYDLAVKDLGKYIAMEGMSNSNLSDGYVNRGLAYYYMGNTSAAISDFTKAIEVYPAMKSAYTNRAVAYRKIGKTALADADEQKASTLD
jgi:tetratricopeptide (TPR) repeat protein